MKPLPATVEELIAELDRLYPEQCPRAGDRRSDIWMTAGAREVVRGLIARRDYYNNPDSMEIF